MATSEFSYFKIGDSRELIESTFDDLAELAVTSKLTVVPALIESAEIILSAFRNNKKLLIMGNGGSAGDAQHFAGEFVSSVAPTIKRRGLPAIALTTNTSMITAYANDFDYEGIFSRQVEALGQPGDVLIGISTSGSSRNCIQAFAKAAEIGLTTIAMTRLGSQMESMATVSVSIPSSDTQRIQEIHVLCFHTICELVENGFMNGAD